MGDFSSRDRILKGDIEDVLIDIDRKERELQLFDEEIKALLKKKEILEDEIESAYLEKKRLDDELRSLENE